MHMVRIRGRTTEGGRSWRTTGLSQVIRNWTLFYVIVFSITLLCSGSATMVAISMQWLASFVAINLLQDFFRPPRRTLGLLYAFGLSLLLRSHKMQSIFYPGCYHLLKPSHTLGKIVHQLRFESKYSPPSLIGIKIPHSFYGNLRPLQASGIGNGYLKTLSHALEVHFDRYARNETETFAYVKTLNLIGNLFDDDSIHILVDALDHPYAYTERLLLGRNLNLGDHSARQLAHLIENHRPYVNGNDEGGGGGSHSNGTVPMGKNLTSLEFGATSVTAKGLKRLYEAMGTRPFGYLGFTHTDKWWGFQNTFIFRPNPIPQSVPDLHKASDLQELELAGNMLGNADMPALVDNLLGKTNVTSLTLINNRIGPDGVFQLAPLATQQLKELNLGLNWRIGDKGAILLANALKGAPNATLENVGMFNCRVGQKGAEAFLSIFPENKRLKQLSLEGKAGSIQKETLQALRKALSANWKSE